MQRITFWFVPPLLLVAILLMPICSCAELTQTEVSESLICYACPGEPLNIDRCGGGDRMRDDITRLINQGKSKPEILDYFVAQFGDSILTTVPKKGFNLVAYTGPFIALLVGVPLALLIIRRWGSVGRRQAAEHDAAEQTVTLDEQTRLKIEKELADLDEEG
jgi:cytochrome c-type biogenesis protein CcmH